jgi:coproporphyrinogen III oxidase
VFPNLLLPALDLLDRRLVSIIRAPAGDGVERKVFIVKSLATTLLTRRPRDANSSTARSYLVDTGAWNCSCASFAFDAFPVTTDEGGGNVNQQDCSFGGVSLNGIAGRGEDVPCCKHLLACLLAERWETVLGAHVEHKETSKEELAGIIAGV